MLQELSADYADWLFDRGFTMADEICLGGEALYSHPFARLLPKAFFGYVVADILRDQLSGEVMGGILAKLTGQVSFPDDDASWWLKAGAIWSAISVRWSATKI